jgi:Flavodoxin domain
MTALVVHESHWGNTRAVARAIADGLAASDGGPVQVVDVTAAPSPLPDDVDLVVLGGPTHAFSMSRATTRRDAHDQGAEPGHEERGIREWLATLPADDTTRAVATFDTRAEQVRRLPGSAARAAGRYVSHHRLGSVVSTESFYVKDSPGPLVDGELDRARAWGVELSALHA